MSLPLYVVQEISRTLRWIGQKAGIRSSVADYFIYNKARRNLTIISGCLVKRVIFKYAFSFDAYDIRYLTLVLVAIVRSA